MIHMLAKLTGQKKYDTKIKTNNSVSAYTWHILSIRHEYDNAEQTTELLKPCNKGVKMNCRETFFIHILQQQDVLIEEQRVNDLCAIYDLAHVTRRYTS
jgi:hypothetical protein